MISNEEILQYRKYQNDVNEIITSEHSRLNSKIANIDANITNQDRMILLNTSYRDKQKKYILIILIFVWMFISALLIIFFQQTFGFSTQVLDVLIFLIIGGGLISAVLVYQEIQNRDKIDFNQLSKTSSNLLPAKPILKVTDTDPNNITQASSSTICRGSTCCDPITQVYDAESRKCKPK
jgi:hypothetical protein